MSPDDILEQSDFPCATLDLARDLIGRLVVAMGIVSPADKKRSGSDFPHAISDDADRPFGLFAFRRDKTIGETGGKAYPPVSSPSSAPACLASSSRRDLSRSGG